MSLSLQMALSAIAYRAAARALQIVAPCLPWRGLPGKRYPSANTITLWSHRLGLAQIKRPKEQADDWVWLVDHTIVTGNGKCLVVLGIRLSDWNRKREAFLAENPDGAFGLTHQDVVPFLIKRVDKSTGQDVCEELEALAKETGIIPAYILCDQGADVRNGGRLFGASGERKTRTIHDIAHAAANALKRQLNKNDDWNSFMGKANRFKTKIRQSEVAFLMPPDLKKKARWMNLQMLIDWSDRMVRFLGNPEAVFEAVVKEEDASGLMEPSDQDPSSKRQEKIDGLVSEAKEKLGWILAYRESLIQWQTMLQAIAIILNYIRNNGYHSCAVGQLSVELAGIQGEKAEKVIDEIMQFVRDQCAHVSEGEAILGSTEVLESLIGKGKQFGGKNKNGYTASVLGMASATCELTLSNIRQSFIEVHVADVINWTKDMIGTSLHAQRVRANAVLAGTKTG